MPDASSLIARGLRHERAGVLDEAMRCYEEAAIEARDPEHQAEALRRQADVLRIRCQWDAALERAVQSERVAEQAGAADALAEAVNAQAAVHQSRGDLGDAARLYARVLELSARERLRGIALQNLGAIAAMAGDHEEAAQRFEESIACFERDGYERGIAIALNNLGRASLERGDSVRAEDVLRRAGEQARKLDDLELAALARVNLAEALVARGAYDEAELEASAALGFFKVSGNQWRQIDCLRLLGDSHAQRQDVSTALRLYQQAIRVAEEIGARNEISALQTRLDGLRAPE